ncbi:MAG: glycosyltransferase family 4 protein [Candidatus Bathyarchaeota archaeon]|nr:glycosyltransferase family 4 protein [Candidatus Bathyarchaeota archaeon]
MNSLEPKMRIYQIMGSEICKSGGREKYVLELTDFLENHDYAVKILCRMGHIYTAQDAMVNSKCETETKFTSNLFVMTQHLPNPLTVVLGVKKLVKEFKNKANCKKVIHVHDISSSVLIGFIVAGIFRSPLLIQIHGLPLREPCIKLRQSQSKASSLIRLLTKIWHTSVVNAISLSSKLVLVNNLEVLSFYQSLGVNRNNLRVVPSAIDVENHKKTLLPSKDALASLGLKPSKDDVVIGFIGRLGPEKNVGLLLKAFAGIAKEYPKINCKLLIIGDGYLKPILKKMAVDYEIDDRTCFAGLLPAAYRFLNAIDIFVLPSLSEGSPVSLIEAMVAGKAIIASNIPGINDIVSSGKEAILIDPYNVEELRHSILLLHNDASLRVQLGYAARTKAQNYDVEPIYGKVLAMYGRHLNNR